MFHITITLPLFILVLIYQFNNEVCNILADRVTSAADISSFSSGRIGFKDVFLPHQAWINPSRAFKVIIG